jgi:hypothetical protein
MAHAIVVSLARSAPLVMTERSSNSVQGAALLAELTAQESQARERKPKKGTGRSCVGDRGYVTPVKKGHAKSGPVEFEGGGVRRAVR